MKHSVPKVTAAPGGFAMAVSYGQVTDEQARAPANVSETGLPRRRTVMTTSNRDVCTLVADNVVVSGHWSERLPKDTCSEALSWARTRPSAEAAWASCPRGDWMLWILGRSSYDRKILVSIACACARTALKYVPAGDDRPLRCIEITESWCRGESMIEDVKNARYAAYAAAADDAAYAYAAADADDADAAYAVAFAAAAAAAAAAYAAAADDVAYAAYAAAYAAATTADARIATQLECADIVRRMASMPVLKVKS